MTGVERELARIATAMEDIAGILSNIQDELPTVAMIAEGVLKAIEEAEYD